MRHPVYLQVDREGRWKTCGLRLCMWTPKVSKCCSRFVYLFLIQLSNKHNPQDPMHKTLYTYHWDRPNFHSLDLSYAWGDMRVSLNPTEMTREISCAGTAKLVTYFLWEFPIMNNTYLQIFEGLEVHTRWLLCIYEAVLRTIAGRPEWKRWR